MISKFYFSIEEIKLILEEYNIFLLGLTGFQEAVLIILFNFFTYWLFFKFLKICRILLNKLLNFIF